MSLAPTASAVFPLPCTEPLVWYQMDERRWTGVPGQVTNAGNLGAALDATAVCDNANLPGCAMQTPRPPKGLPSTIGVNGTAISAPLPLGDNNIAFFKAPSQRGPLPKAGCGRAGYFNWGKTTLAIVGGKTTVTNNYRQFLQADTADGLNTLTTQMTITGWVNPYHRPPGGFVMTIVNHGKHFKLSLQRGYLRADWVNAAGQLRSVLSTTTVDASDGDPDWHHVAFVFDQGTPYLYVDGVEVAGYQNAAYQPYLDLAGAPVRPTFPGDVLTPVAGAPLQIGYTTDPAMMFGTTANPQGDPYRGLLDDVRIYGSALAPAYIEQFVTRHRPCECF